MSRKSEFTIIITLLVIYLCWYWCSCNEMYRKDFGVQNQSDTLQNYSFILPKYDSTVHTVTQPEPIRIIDSFAYPVSETVFVDTQEIIRRYFTAYLVADSFRNQDLTITVRDSLKHGAITWREYQYKILRPDSVINNTITIEKNSNNPELYAGLGIGVTGNSVSVIPKISYCTPSGKMFEAGLLFNNVKPGIYAGINLKLR